MNIGKKKKRNPKEQGKSPRRTRDQEYAGAGPGSNEKVGIQPNKRSSNAPSVARHIKQSKECVK
jgi:hypothetical protein